MSAHFVPVATFGTGVEADMARAQLESAGILVLSQGENVGIFGPGFGGQVLGGVTLSVPEPELARALSLLDLPEILPESLDAPAPELPKD
jgi:hypothetical protein